MAKVYSETKKPLAEAIDALASHKNALLRVWRRELQQLSPERERLTSFEGAELWKLTGAVSRLSFPVFRSRMERLGHDLASYGVPLDRVVSAQNALLEMALRFLIKEEPQYAVAVLRFHYVTRTILVAAYSQQQEQKIALLEAKLTDAEQRLHGASAYVTKVYEQERRSLSHDLHDEIGHDLVMLKLYLELLAGDIEQHRYSSLRPRLDDARNLVGHTIESVRRLVLDLGPAIFDDLGFVPALKFYARRFSSSTGVHVTVNEGALPEEIPLTHQVALYRVLQGALSNVVKHARAKNVKVALGSVKGAVLVMTIEDDGVGFDYQSTLPVRRFGLTAMRERIEVLGGKVHVQSWRIGATGMRHGTRIEVDIPLHGSEPS